MHTWDPPLVFYFSVNQGFNLEMWPEDVSVEYFKRKIFSIPCKIPWLLCWQEKKLKIEWKKMETNILYWVVQSIITKCSSHTIIWDHKHYVTKTKTGCSTIIKYRSPNSRLWNKFGYNFSHQYFFSTCHGNQINNQRVLKNIYHVTWIQRIWTVIKSSTITASSSTDRTLASL